MNKMVFALLHRLFAFFFPGDLREGFNCPGVFPQRAVRTCCTKVLGNTPCNTIGFASKRSSGCLGRSVELKFSSHMAVYLRAVF